MNPRWMAQLLQRLNLRSYSREISVLERQPPISVGKQHSEYSEVNDP
jgi:hypothetical protein